MDLQTTPLHEWHRKHHATMAEFGGYHMPLWYGSGVKAEHRAIITAAGLFDTSHMSVVTVAGPGAFELLQHCFTRDLRSCVGAKPGPLVTGRCVYGLFLTPGGTVLDDAIISQLGPGRYMVVVNAGMGGPVSAHLSGHAGGEVEIIDHSGKIGKIDLQGPAAAHILAPLLTDPDGVLDDLLYFSFKGDIFSDDGLRLKDGTPLLLSRTGYTGEFGFELYMDAAANEAVWERLLESGRSRDVLACGLAARDSLRAGAMLPLSHQDIGDWLFANTPWSFVLPWSEDGTVFSKSFIGDAAVAAGGAAHTCGFAGFDPRKIPVTPDTVVLDASGRPIGTVLTCTTDMAIDRVDGRIVSLATPVEKGRPADFEPKGLSCGFVRLETPCHAGNIVHLSHGSRKIRVEIRNEIRPDRTARRAMRVMRRTD